MFTVSWIDLVIICVFAIGIYSGTKNKVINEFSKLIGFYFATVISLHYYIRLGQLLKQNKFISLGEFSDIIAFLLLAEGLVLLFYFVHESWLVILRFQFEPIVEKTISTCLAVIKSYLLCGLVFLAFLILGNASITKSTHKALTSKIFSRVSVGIYKSWYDGFAVNLFPSETFNQAVEDLVRHQDSPENNYDLTTD